MSITRTQANLRSDIRKFCDIQGTTATNRHPDADLNEYINRALGSYHRLLTQYVPDARFLASATATTVSGTKSYSIASDFSVTDLDSLFSVDIEAEGVKTWLTRWEPNEYAALTDTNATYVGIPYRYRLQAGNLVLLPEPAGAYTVTIWYITTPTQLAGDSETMETINRLDEYVTLYASRYVALKDKQWDLLTNIRAELGRLEGEVAAVGRRRDRNSPARIVDESLKDSASGGYYQRRSWRRYR